MKTSLYFQAYLLWTESIHLKNKQKLKSYIAPCYRISKKKWTTRSVHMFAERAPLLQYQQPDAQKAWKVIS